MGSANGRTLSGADSAWWHMEEVTNQMAITAVLCFDGPLDPGRFRDLLRDRLLRHDRFRQRVVEPHLGLGRPRWIDDEGLDIERHLATVSLPPPADQTALETLVGQEMSAPLDSDRPLWRMVYVDNYGGGSAIIARLHHCIADGLALVRLLLTLDDEEGNETEFYGRGRVDRLLDHGHGAVAGGIRLGARTVGAVGRIVGMRPDPVTPLRGRLGTRKCAAWSRPWCLGELRDVAHRAGATLNDVVIAGIAGSLAGFIASNGDRIVRRIRAVVPVNLRRFDDMESLGNRFGLVFAPLPIDIGDPLARLERVSGAMGRLKRSPEAGVVFGLLEVFGRTPRRALDLAVAFLGSKATLVLTNVPGPRERIRFCGREVTDLIAWVPQSGRLGLGISVLSYGDELRLGLAADAGLVADPAVLVRGYEAATAQLFESVGVEAVGVGA